MSFGDRLRIKWRRWKLFRAYGKIAHIELEKSHGFTPTMRTYELLERDGWAVLEDGDLRWTDDRVS